MLAILPYIFHNQSTHNFRSQRHKFKAVLIQKQDLKNQCLNCLLHWIPERAYLQFWLAREGPLVMVKKAQESTCQPKQIKNLLKLSQIVEKSFDLQQIFDAT